MTVHTMRHSIVPFAEAVRRPRRLALGVFDGVHLGHAEVIRGADSVVTFDPPPALLFGRADPCHLLTTLDQRARAVAALGMAELIVVDFTREVAAIGAAEFIDRWLVERLGAERVSVGASFRFGHRAQGTPERLAACPAFETRVVPPISRDGTTISSSWIRDLVRAGDLPGAASLLGRDFALAGTLDASVFTPDPCQVRPAPGSYTGFLQVRDEAVPVEAVSGPAGWLVGRSLPGAPATLRLVRRTGP
ncbi:hypothetical protein [Herbidospora mongoliensis]|uniref:hypothetical protein n=1 Tax=Herbidospora mongoliensis TaxID=688067 RepID=UPI000B1EEEFB|nr:hypothetical protein [Herbidospora mongoliensis]